jgi:biuret amidohydrolase
MPVDIRRLVAPEHTAVLTVEVQRNVVGEESAVPPLAQAVADGGVLDRIAGLCRGARRVGIPVIHCTAERRPDGLGANRNARLFALAQRESGGAPPAPSERPSPFEVHPAVGVQESDLVMPRLHGVSPMAGTSLDPVLRNLEVRTIVATGVSVNVALLGLSFEAVDLGYQVVIPRDATAGVGADYVDAVFANTLSLLTTLTTTDAVLDAWREPDEAQRR